MHLKVCDKLKQRFPNQPWRWRSEWETGMLSTKSKNATLGSLAIAVGWNVIAVALTILILPGELKDQNHVALAVLLFPLVGIVFAIMAIRSVWRYFKFGESSFQLAFNPGVIGGTLAGVLSTSAKLNSDDGYRVTLSCIHRQVRGTGKHRRVHLDVLWQSIQTVHRDLTDGDQSRTSIPVQFSIPFEVSPSSSNADLKDCVYWKLDATAAVPGIDYTASFEVPVFQTEASDPGFRCEQPSVETLGYVPTFEDVYREAKLLRVDDGRNIEVHFPLFRCAREAWGATLMLLVWGGVTGGLSHALWTDGVGTFIGLVGVAFVGVFALVGCVFMLVVADLWLWCGTISSSSSGIKATTGIPGLVREKLFDRDAIETMTFKKSMQVGESIYYDLSLKTRDGQKYCVGRRIINEATVRVIIDDLLSPLGLDQQTTDRGNARFESTSTSQKQMVST